MLFEHILDTYFNVFTSTRKANTDWVIDSCEGNNGAFDYKVSGSDILPYGKYIKYISIEADGFEYTIRYYINIKKIPNLNSDSEEESDEEDEELDKEELDKEELAIRKKINKFEENIDNTDFDSIDFSFYDDNTIEVELVINFSSLKVKDEERLEKRNKELKIKNEKLEEELNKLKEFIDLMPDGKLFLQAKYNFNNNLNNLVNN